MFQVNTDIVGLLVIIFVTIFYLLPLFPFLSAIHFLPFVLLTEHFILFYFLSLFTMSFCVCVLFFTGYPRVCNILIHLNNCPLFK